MLIPPPFLLSSRRNLPCPSLLFRSIAEDLLPLLLLLLLHFLLSFPKGICVCCCPSCCRSRRESVFAVALLVVIPEGNLCLHLLLHFFLSFPKGTCCSHPSAQHQRSGRSLTPAVLPRSPELPRALRPAPPHRFPQPPRDPAGRRPFHRPWPRSAQPLYPPARGPLGPL